ncbi:hypothetical protein [Klebsiella michiganensis]|uniref:hypothetical protein n=1 Tax=Klebsiella michiganensis TaxID=1134687 RepID=UPI00313333E7
MTTDITKLAQRVKTEVSAIDDTQWYLAKPSEIRSLVEALEKAQETIAFQQGEIKALLSSLESRTVTVKLPKRSVGEVMHMSGFSRDYAEGWCAGNDNAIHEMRVAGIKVEAE